MAGGSEGERLGSPVHLGAPVRGHGLDRRAWQRVVGCEQPAQRLHLAKATVKEQCERAVKPLDDLVAFEEGGRYAHRAVWPLHREQLAIAEQLLDAAEWDTEPVCYLGEAEPLTDESVGRGVYLCHTPDVAIPGPRQTWKSLDERHVPGRWRSGDERMNRAR